MAAKLCFDRLRYQHNELQFLLFVIRMHEHRTSKRRVCTVLTFARTERAQKPKQ